MCVAALHPAGEVSLGVRGVDPSWPVQYRNGVELGSVVADKYRVEKELGRGGMGVVLKAVHTQLGQPVAIKLLLPEALRDPQIPQRFLQEARASVRLRSEHVARVFDVGTLDDGAPYMVLEYLEGNDLSNIDRGQLSIGALVDLLLKRDRHVRALSQASHHACDGPCHVDGPDSRRRRQRDADGDVW